MSEKKTIVIVMFMILGAAALSGLAGVLIHDSQDNNEIVIFDELGVSLTSEGYEEVCENVCYEKGHDGSLGGSKIRGVGTCSCYRHILDYDVEG